MTRKKAAAKSKSTAAKSRQANARKKADTKSSRAKEHVKLLPSGAVDEYRVDSLPWASIDKIKVNLDEAMETFRRISEQNLTRLQRRRKKGAGIRNYGFIEKAADLAEDNQQYVQFFDFEDLHNSIVNFDICRNFILQLQGFLKMVTNSALTYSDGALDMSLLFYNMIKEMSRRGDPIAESLFAALSPFFKKKKPATALLTDKEAMREMNALLKSKKDGKFIIENINPKLIGGVHKVIEEKLSDTEQFKETKNGEIKE